MKIKTSGSKNPTANLAINRSRIKKYGGKNSIPSYYLEKGQEFQIELYNPTQGKVLTTIKLNNKSVSGGLVLKPGERVFLDRFLETNKKFLFDTYNVDNIKSAVKAIANNGDLEVAFFKEVTTKPLWSWGNSNGTMTLDNHGNNTSTVNFNSINTTNTGGVTTDAININTTTEADFRYNQLGLDQDFFIPCRSDGISSNPSPSVVSTFTSAGVNSLRGAKILKSKKGSFVNPSPTIETGRVEEGSASNQKLKSATGDYEMTSFHVIRYKLLPKSQKLSTTVEYYSKYCNDCGGKCKTKFCPFCGKKQ